MRLLRWLLPGVKVKRWVLLGSAGLLLCAFGLATLVGAEFLGAVERSYVRFFLETTGHLLAPFWSGLLSVAGGILLLALSVGRILGTLVPAPRGRLADAIFDRRRLDGGPRIVAIGGGTGLPVLLRGLKEYTGNITAIVTVADDGGSSGRLRGDLGMPAPGDIRNCLVALADTEPLMEELFQYRFEEGGLKGHSFGNLFIAALSQVTGDFELAVRESHKVLAVRGQVLPATLGAAALCAELDDGTVVRGESAIPEAVAERQRAGREVRIRRVYLEGRAEPPPAALRAIAEADLVILGPGSLYTSILPNLVVPGVAEALAASPAVKVYVCNVMTQPGETRGYTASDHVRALREHAREGAVDYVLVNVQPVPADLLERYAAEGAHPVRVDRAKVRALGPQVVEADLLYCQGYVRHDAAKLAAAILRLALRDRRFSRRLGLFELCALRERLRDHVSGTR